MESRIRILFWLYRSRQNAKGLCPIKLRITVEGTREELSTGFAVNPDNWDARRCAVKGKSSEAVEINKGLDGLKSKVLKVYNNLQELEMPVSAEIIKLKLDGQQEEVKSLMEVFTYHNEQLRAKLGVETTRATLQKYETLKKKVGEYLQHQYKRNDIYLKELNHRFIVDFETYLRTIGKLSHNPTIKYIQFFKKITNLSVANEWIPKNPFANFKCSLREVERGYLTKDELAAIESAQITFSRLERIRDVFVFCCYTGLSYTDARKLTSNHVINGIDGNRWIVINRTKTDVRSPIPLLPKALEILEKYSTDSRLQEKGRLLPVLSNQKTNSYLKELGDMCKITKNVTFHLSRHTFATTITLANGVPIETVSKMLGHTNLKTTQIYAKVVDTKISHDMERLKQRLA